VSVSETTIRFSALDTYELGGTLYSSLRRSRSELVAILSCGAGIPAYKYAYFARYVATAGIPVFTYDYRGIGASRPKRLRGFVATAEDWAELDYGGAISCVRGIFPEAKLVSIAHSVGALLVGGAPNASEIYRYVFISGHTGYFRDYAARYRIPMLLVWHAVMPLATRVLGYFPAKFLRLGDDIPAGVALQWAARLTPYLRPEATGRDGTRAKEMIARYRGLAGAVLVARATDDAFATATGTQRLLSNFPALRPEYFVIAPSDVGLKHIGHFGFFRRSALPKLWPAFLERIAIPYAHD